MAKKALTIEEFISRAIKYCNKNSIPLLRISYEKSKAISEILTDELVMADEGIA